MEGAAYFGFMWDDMHHLKFAIAVLEQSDLLLVLVQNGVCVENVFRTDAGNRLYQLFIFDSLLIGNRFLSGIRSVMSGEAFV